MARGPLSQKRLKFYAASNAAAFWRKIVTQMGDEFSEEFSDRALRRAQRSRVNWGLAIRYEVGRVEKGTRWR
jgi:hypothetical protein